MKGKKSAFEKRVKRNVVARKQDFFVSVSPSFTDLCFDEIKGFDLNTDEVRKVEGGIEVTGNLTDCYKINFFSRIANRVLMRVLSFKATNFKVMGQKIKSLPWELYLNPGIELDISVTSKRSRLNHTKAISERVEDEIYRALASSGMEAEYDENRTQRIFVRVVDDFFTISIDSTGDNLYKRGVKDIGGPAPLRENIASALLKIAGFDKNTILFDPMCGTGTFSMEAYMEKAEIPPGFFRHFSFEKWPGFSEPGFNYIKKEVSKNIKKPDKPFIFASDKNTGLIEELKKCIEKKGFNDGIDISVRNFFKTEFALNDRGKILLMFNPPFGRRIGSKGDSHKVLNDIKEKLKKDFKGCRFGLILPFRDMKYDFPDSKEKGFIHGGLKLTFVTGTIKP